MIWAIPDDTDTATGFDYREVVTVQVFTSPAKYPDTGTVADLHTRAVEQLRGLPTASDVLRWVLGSSAIPSG